MFSWKWSWKETYGAFFGKEYITKYNYLHEKETNISLKKDTKINITVRLLKPYEINFRGKLIYKTEFKSFVFKNSNNSINKNLNKILNDTINLDTIPIEKFIDESFSKRNVIYGDVMINFNWTFNKIEIDLGSKISVPYHGYRGGLRFIFI